MDFRNRSFLPSIFAGTAAVAGMAPEDCLAAPEKDKPNIFVIMTDQQTADALSCAGNPYVETPAMDALAQDGCRFTRAYCPFPLSGPCRASLMTGMMPSEIGARDNGVRPDAEAMGNTLGHRLSEAGYECLYAGKWHIPEVNLPAYGTGFRGISKMHDPSLPDSCGEALDKYDGKKPLFMVASFLNPHEICEYARFESLHYGELPAFNLEDCPNLPRNFMPSTYEPEAVRLEQKAAPRSHDTATYTQDDWRRYLYAYYRLVERVDMEIGRLVAEIKEHGLYDDSVIILLSDHGEGMAAHGWNQKWALFEECINIPLIVKGPSGKGGVCNETALSNIGLDLYATVCDYAGVKLDREKYQGKSLRPVVEGKSSELHPEVIVETFLSSAGIRGWCVIENDFKYVFYQWGRNREALYDMSSDKGEMLNLAVDRKYSDVLQRMRDKLYKWSLRIDDSRLIRNMAAFQEK